MGVERTGTVTFLFTDIEGSTQRWRDDEAAMAAALRDHDEVLTTTIERHGGHVFKHTGDGIVAVFESATAAVRAALAAQVALDLPVRMGLHTGEAEHRDGDYFGPSLNRCARIMDAGHGGQILVSSATRQLVAGTTGVDIRDLGTHRLKGLDEPLAIHQIGSADHPPLRTLSGDVRLPTITTELVGRDELVDEVVRTIDEHRVVTLTGAGGTGKTRVAIAAARERATRHGVVAFVDLSEIADDEEVLAAVCRTLDVADHHADALELALTGRHPLLVFDNCEHVLAAAGDLAESLLRLPALRILATSREGLGVAGERLIAVPGLATDDTTSAAVHMFLQRADIGGPDHRPTGDELDAVQHICRRLDGLPLAIELAAARTSVLSPRDLLDRLDERFQLLTGGRRRRNRDRQRTLRETIDWSYELLDDDERDIFERMSMFGGSFALDSAVAIAAHHDDYETLDLLGALIDKSLLTTIEVEGQHRYRYLETIRSYAEERFDGRSDRDALLDRLGTHLAELTRDIVGALDVDPRQAARRLRAEIPNLRTSFDHALEQHDITAATALIGPLAQVASVVDWRISGWPAEALALDGATTSASGPALLAAHLIDQWLQGRFDLLGELTERTLSAAAAHGTVSRIVDNAVIGGFHLTGNDQRLEQHASEILRRDTIDDDVRLWLATMLAWIHTEPGSPGDDPTWTKDDEAAVAASIEHPSALVRLPGLIVRGLRARALGDYDLMLRSAAEVIDLGVPGSPLWFCGLQIHSLAELYLCRPGSALQSADADLDEAYRLGDRSAMVLPLLVNALVLESLGEIEAAATIRGRLPRRLTVMFIRELADLDRRLRTQLDPDRWRELTTTGSQMDPRQLQALTHESAARHLQLPATA